MRKRKTGKDYSQGWYTSVQDFLRRVPFQLEEASPKAIRAWVMAQQKQGLSGRTIEIRCATGASLIKTSQRSGLLDTEKNPFELVDYSNNSSKHIPTATLEDIRRIKPRSISTPVELALTMQAMLGTRVSEVLRSDISWFDLEEGTFTVKEGKNKASLRTIPLPKVVVEAVRTIPLDWPSPETIRAAIKRVNPELSSHSLRHGFIRLGRDLGCDTDVIEAAVGHTLGGQKATYGDGYGVDRMREEMSKIWDKITG